MSDHRELSDVTIANKDTAHTHKESISVTSQPPPIWSEVASAHHIPPQTRSAIKAPLVPPPHHLSDLKDHEKDQLKIDLQKARMTIGISPIKKEDIQLWIEEDINDVKGDDMYYSDKFEQSRKSTATDYLVNWLLMKKTMYT